MSGKFSPWVLASAGLMALVLALPSIGAEPKDKAADPLAQQAL